MKIVVLVTQVATLDEQFELDDSGARLDPDSVDWELNEWDSFALEEAVQLREQSGGEVVAASVGDQAASDALVTCLAKGADRAVRVWGDELQDSDALGVALVLAELTRREQPDLVLCGVQASDWASGATGTALSAFAGLPRVAVVRSIAFEDGGLLVKRELEGGVIEVLGLTTPAVLTVQTGINEPRYANFRALKQAREKPIEEVSPGDLGLDADVIAAASGSRVIGMWAPEKGSAAEMITGDATAVAERIAELVQEGVGGADS